MAKITEITSKEFEDYYKKDFLSIIHSPDELSKNDFFFKGTAWSINGSFFKNKWDLMLLTGERVSRFDHIYLSSILQSVRIFDDRMIMSTIVDYSIENEKPEFGPNNHYEIQIANGFEKAECLQKELHKWTYPGIFDTAIFGSSKCWGLLCTEWYQIIGGKEEFMEKFHSIAGDRENLKNRFYKTFPPYEKPDPLKDPWAVRLKHELIKSVGWDLNEFRELDEYRDPEKMENGR